MHAGRLPPVSPPAGGLSTLSSASLERRLRKLILNCHPERSEGSIKRHTYSPIDPSFLRMTNFPLSLLHLSLFHSPLFPPKAKRGARAQQRAGESIPWLAPTYQFNYRALANPVCAWLTAASTCATDENPCFFQTSFLF
ncbi:MAG: hypothetical protein JWR38_5040 [Mucilaginibacter sp.]|nr:hypothetical protein [Mucilaginibacter sp.]